jgi:hypothetical protein
MTLTDTQLLVLSSASQRQDGLAALPDHLKGGAARSIVLKLIASGLLEEAVVTRDDPHWRKDEADQPIGLRITRAGLETIGIEPEEDSAGADKVTAGVSPSEPESPEPGSSRSLAPRDGSKRALVIALLSRPESASLDELVAATGWLPHTTRAALTGLRQNGYEITRTRSEDGRSLYRIMNSKGPTSVPAAAASEA